MSDKIEPRKERVNTLRGLLDTAKDQFAIALPRHLSVDKLLRMSVTVLAKNEDLLRCSAESVVGAIMECAQLGLYPDNTVLGHAYLVPFNVKVKGTDGQPRWIKRCQLIPGYRGLLDLCRRSGATQWVDAFPVFEGDNFDYAYGSEPFILHKPALPGAPITAPDGTPVWEDPPLTFVYAIGKLADGDLRFRVMSRRDVEKIRGRSRAADKGPWVTDYSAMCLKTVLRQWCKYVSMSPEITRAVALDELHEVGVDQRLADYARPMLPASAREEEGMEFPNGDALDQLADAFEAAKENGTMEEDAIDITPPEDGGDELPPPPVTTAEYDRLVALAFERWKDEGHSKLTALRRSLKLPLDVEFMELKPQQKEKYIRGLKVALNVS